MKAFDARFHKTFRTAADALAYIDKTKAGQPSPYWQHLTFTVQPVPKPDIGVYIEVDATTAAAHRFASEELAVRGMDVPYGSTA